MPHIHYKVILNDNVHLTSELYFPEDFCNELFSSIEPYSQYGNSPYDFSNDKSLENMKEGTGLILSPENQPDNSVFATAKIGIELKEA
ncbi:MAG: hypothetical protein NXI00_17065 [Cytophagales bacterium]|nr:hypothetical protein [Cytophagales bacterium]